MAVQGDERNQSVFDLAVRYEARRAMRQRAMVEVESPKGTSTSGPGRRGSHLHPTPTDRSVRISRTTLFRYWFTAPRSIATVNKILQFLVAVTETLPLFAQMLPMLLALSASTA